MVPHDPSSKPTNIQMVPSLPSGPEIRRKWKGADGLAKPRRLINPSEPLGSAKKIP